MRKFIITLTLVSVLALSILIPVWAEGSDPVAVLKSDAPFPEKMQACRDLVNKGGKDAVPALAALLGDEKLSHMARWALEPMPCPEAGAALRDALGKTSGHIKVGIISSLGIRKDEQAVPELIKLLSDADEEVAEAAALSLSKIATDAAVKALDDAVHGQGGATPCPARLRAVCDGLCGCAEKLAAKGQQDQAAAIYEHLLNVANAPKQVQAAALRGAVLMRGGEKGLPLIVAALRGDDETKFDAALRVVRELDPKQDVSPALAEVLSAAPPERKVRLIEVIGQRGGSAAGPAAMAQAKADSPEVTVAALRALTRMAYVPSLELMAQLAWSAEGVVAKTARASLSYFPGKERETCIKAMLDNEHPEARVVAVELIGGGAIDAPVGLLMKRAETDADENVRIAAFRALQDSAGIDEMPALFERLFKAGSPAEMQAVEGTLNALCAKQKRMAGSVVIQKAVYGSLPDGPSADVLAKVKSIVDSGVLAVDASNTNFGDTAPGLVKKLRVDYTENGNPITKTVLENQTLKLTVASAPSAVTDAFCAAFEKAQGDAKLAVTRLLSATGSRKALDIVVAASKGGQGPLKDTALHVLCDWPTSDALPMLMDLAKTSSDETLKVIALRGAVRLLAQNNAPATETLDQYVTLMNGATTADEKKTVLGGLAQVPLPGAFELALRQFGDETVKAEAVQAAIAIAKTFGKSAREDGGIFNGKDLTGWHGDPNLWRLEDGAIVGGSATAIPRNEFIWSDAEVGDFYLAVDIQLEPNTGNGGVQFRSKKVDEHGQALGYQADVGQDCWGRLYHEHGRGKLDWTDRGEKAVKPGEWNHYEILAIGPAIWTAINGQLSVAYLDLSKDAERKGLIAFQLHGGPPQKVRYRLTKLVHDPKTELGPLNAESLISALNVPEKQ